MPVRSSSQPTADAVPSIAWSLTVGGAAGAPLAQQVPAAVQLHLDRPEALLVLLERSRVRAVRLLSIAHDRPAFLFRFFGKCRHLAEIALEVLAPSGPATASAPGPPIG